MKHPVGTKFKSGGKCPRICTVTDFFTVTNLAGEIVRQYYVAEHEFMGQTVTNYEVPQASIDRHKITEER